MYPLPHLENYGFTDEKMNLKRGVLVTSHALQEDIFSHYSILKGYQERRNPSFLCLTTVSSRRLLEAKSNLILLWD